MESLNLIVDSTNFKHLKFDEINGRYIATLIDNVGFEIVKGYGETKVAAINDLHSCLI